MAILFQSFTAGFLLGASLIIAIGAQNAFILKQGLLKQHVFILCLVCALSDALLIVVGVSGFGTLFSNVPNVIAVITILGILFLSAYGLFAFWRAFKPKAMDIEKGEGQSLKMAVATCLALTFLNPHVYLDTVLLLGGISLKYEDETKIAFASGAVLASFSWFFALGYGARLLVPVFQKPLSWRILDGLIGMIMFLIAFSLAQSLFA